MSVRRESLLDQDDQSRCIDGMVYNYVLGHTQAQVDPLARAPRNPALALSLSGWGMFRSIPLSCRYFLNSRRMTGK